MPEPLKIVKREPLPPPPPEPASPLDTYTDPLQALRKAQTITAAPDELDLLRSPGLQQVGNTPLGPFAEAASRLREWANQTEQLGISGGSPIQGRIGGFLAGAVGGMPEGAIKPSWMPNWLWALSGGGGPRGGIAGQVESQATPVSLGAMLPFSHLPPALRGEAQVAAPVWEGLPGLYSPLLRTVEKQGKTLSVKKWLEVIKSAPLAERSWKQVEPWLQAKVGQASTGPLSRSEWLQAADRVMVPKQDLLDYLATRKVSLKHVGYMKGTFDEAQPRVRPLDPMDFIGPVEDLGNNRFQIQFDPHVTNLNLQGQRATWEQTGGLWKATVPAVFTPEGAGSMGLGSQFFDTEAEARAWVRDQLTNPDREGYQLLADRALALTPPPPPPDSQIPALREFRTPQTPLNAPGYSLPNRVAALWKTYRYKRLTMPGEIPENQLDPQAHPGGHSAPEYNRVVHVRSQNYLLLGQPVPPKWNIIDKATGRVIAEEWFPNEAEKTRLAGPGKGADREVVYVPGGTTSEPEMRGRTVDEVQSDWANLARGARDDEVERLTNKYTHEAVTAQERARQQDPNAPQRPREDLEYEAGQRAEKEVPEHWGWKFPGDTLEQQAQTARTLAQNRMIEVKNQARAATGLTYSGPDDWPDPFKSEYKALEARANELGREAQTLRARKPVMPFAGPYNPFGYVDLALKAELLDAAKRKGLQWIGIVGGSENAARYGSGYAFPYSKVKIEPRSGELRFESPQHGHLLTPQQIKRAHPPLTATSKAALDYLGPEELADLSQQHDAFKAAHPNQTPFNPEFQHAYVYSGYDHTTNNYYHYIEGLPDDPVTGAAHPMSQQRYANQAEAQQALDTAKAAANTNYDPAWEDPSQWPSVSIPEGQRLGPTQTGKGMYLAYDERYRHTLERLLAPFGGKLAQLRLVPGSSGRQAYLWMMQLTPEMKEKILASGFPLFTALAALQTAGAPDSVLDYVRARALEREGPQRPKPGTRPGTISQ